MNHLLGLELVLSDGKVLRIDRSPGVPGYDLAGLITGSEGTFGVVTAAVLRLIPDPEAILTLLAVFPDVASASRAVSQIIAVGIVPAALEMMDALVVEAVESAYHFGFPPDAGAVLIVELDGLLAGLEELGKRVEACCVQAGSTSIKHAASSDERALLWKSRKRAFGAMGRLTRAYCTQDGVVPRSRLPEIAEVIKDTARKHRLRIATLMHAGDGNIHPLILYDDRDVDEMKRVILAGNDILLACVRMGGSLSGEHGIGIEKVGLISEAFSSDEIDAMVAVRGAFDPDGLCNPNKMFPTDRRCIEIKRPRPRGGG